MKEVELNLLKSRLEKILRVEIKEHQLLKFADKAKEIDMTTEDAVNFIEKQEFTPREISRFLGGI